MNSIDYGSASPSGTADLSSIALEQYFKSRDGVITSAGQALKNAGRVSRTLYAIAVMQTLAAIGTMIDVLPFAERPEAKIAIGSAWFMAVLFWLLAAWAKASPLPPAIAAATVYLTMQWATFAYSWAIIERQFGEDEAARRMGSTPLTLVKIAIFFGLIRAIYSGVKHRRLTALAETTLPAVQFPAPALDPQPPARRRIAGVGTSLALFFMLLYSCINITALWGSRELTPHVLYVQKVIYRF